MVFEQFYKDTYREALRWMIKRVGDKDIAEDLVQEGFIRLWKRLEVSSEGINYRAYFFKILNNTYIDHLRYTRAFVRDRNHSVSLDSVENAVLDKTHVFADDGQDTSRLAEVDEFMTQVSGILSPYEKRIFFAWCEGMGPKEIAAGTGESQNVVSVSLYRVRKKILKEIAVREGRAVQQLRFLRGELVF